jgi:hypothetical protein
MLYIGVKIINSIPMTLGVYNEYRGWEIPKDEDPERDGYLVTYPKGPGQPEPYETWSPKEVHENCYFPMDASDGTTVTEEMVNKFMGIAQGKRLDEKTTLIKAETMTGFVKYEVSSCVDPENYDHKLGLKIGADKIKSKIWENLGFLLQWGRYGLINRVEEAEKETGANCQTTAEKEENA